MTHDHLFAMVNHLWQSTLFCAVLVLVAFLLQDARAAVRYRLWFAASIKFLIPFAALAAWGAGFQLPTIGVSSAEWSSVTGSIYEPLVASEPGIRRLPHADATSTNGMWILVALWACGAVVVLLRWLREWCRLRTIRLNAMPTSLEMPLPVLMTSAAIEPGVLGLFNPVLLIPTGLQEKLTAEQFNAIVAHELCHVSRRDNVGAALHMVVEMIFWFHPLVWWLERRMIEERERACDDAVLSGGNASEDYAEGVLRVCRFYRESRLMCSSGVTGSDLKQRIEHIMRNKPAIPLGTLRTTLLLATLVISIAMPVAVGVLNAGVVQALPTSISGPSFEVASIRANSPGDRARRSNASLEAGRYIATNQTLKYYIALAYAPVATFPAVIPLSAERISGGPDWLEKDRFAIEATAGRGVTGPELAQMLRHLLADRFALKTHVASRQQSVFELVRRNPTSLGPSLHVGAACNNKDARQGVGGGPGESLLHCASMALFAEVLSEMVDRPVIDQTGLAGLYDGVLTHATTDAEGLAVFGGARPPDDADLGRPSIITALQEQFGLKLVSQRRSVQYLVIDNARKPTDN